MTPADLGARARLEAAFAREVGDTINVASRLQALTRELGATIVASAALVGAVEREATDHGVLKGLGARGPQLLRGRDTAIELWAE